MAIGSYGEPDLEALHAVTAERLAAEDQRRSRELDRLVFGKCPCGNRAEGEDASGMCIDCATSPIRRKRRWAKRLLKFEGRAMPRFSKCANCGKPCLKRKKLCSFCGRGDWRRTRPPEILRNMPDPAKLPIEYLIRCVECLKEQLSELLTAAR